MDLKLATPLDELGMKDAAICKWTIEFWPANLNRGLFDGLLGMSSFYNRPSLVKTRHHLRCIDVSGRFPTQLVRQSTVRQMSLRDAHLVLINTQQKNEN